MHVLLTQSCTLAANVCVHSARANKALAMCLFSFNDDDLQTAAAIVRKRLAASERGPGSIPWLTKTVKELIELLPLSTWTQLVRRKYLSPDEQLRNIELWWKTYVLAETAFVAVVDGKVKALVRGGKQGLERFAKVMASQLTLVEKGMLSGEFVSAASCSLLHCGTCGPASQLESTQLTLGCTRFLCCCADPPGMDMYELVGVSKEGAKLWRSKRGSSKNEAFNLNIERSMHTTGKMKEETAMGAHAGSEWLSMHAHAAHVTLRVTQSNTSDLADCMCVRRHLL